ncbi:hypothetical protein IWW51_002119 [Coemansia sp. RSA 2702]|nr:hypothetical protein IWW54_003471 [Coemansia sp. RSA 2705]KAJ2326731.1 hypothetical protein IWW51_002119 [Coemansia sp. RSA 2702]
MEFTHAHALALSSIVSQYGSQLEMLFIEQTGHCIEVLNPELALEFNAQLEDKVVLDPNGNVKADIPQPLPLSVDARYARRIYYCDNVPHDRRIPLWNRSSSNDLRFDKLEELDLRSDTLFTPCFNNTDWSDVKFPSLKRLSVFRFAITPRFVECLQQAPLRRLEYRVGDINSIRNLAPVVGKLEHLQLECDFRKFVEPERVRSQFIRDSHEDMMGVLNSALKKAQNARVVRVGLIWSDVCLRVSKLDCPFITHLSVQGAFEFRDLLTVLPTMVNLVDLMLFNISAAEADSEQDAVWLRDYNRGCMDRPASNVKKLKLGYETSAMMRFYNEQLENIQWFIPNAKITIEEMYDY